MRVAIVGDVHGAWSQEDNEALDALGYDLVLFVGDLADMLHLRTLATARAISGLRTRALMIPGNHDATSPAGVLAEALGVGLVRPGLAARGVRRIDALQAALGPVALVGYTVHPFPEHGLTLIAARPHAMDGRRACFAPLLEARFGIGNLGASIRRLEELVDVTKGPLLFLGHNGPLGLGHGPRDPWSVAGRDIGDPDLAAAIHHAHRERRQVCAVVAGHVHHRGDDRDWQRVHEGVLHVNAARVPRVRTDDEGRVWRHHVVLTVAGATVSAEACWR